MVNLRRENTLTLKSEYFENENFAYSFLYSQDLTKCFAKKSVNPYWMINRMNEWMNKIFTK